MITESLLQGTIRAGKTNVWIGIDDDGKILFRARKAGMLPLEREINLKAKVPDSFDQQVDPIYDGVG